MLALAATLLMAAFATATARAQEAVPVEPPPDAQLQPPAPDPPPAPTVPDQAPTETTPPADTAPQPPPDSGAGPADPGSTGSGDVVADTPPATQGSDRNPARVPSKDGGGGGPSSAPAPVSTTTVPAPTSDSTVDTVPPGSDGYPGNWSGQDTFVVDGGKDADTGVAAAFGGPRGPLAGLLALGAGSRASSLVVKARRGHTAAQANPIGGPPGSGGQLPGQSPFFNLLSGPGGSPAGIALASILAILGAALVLPRDRSRRFRMPTVTWRPLAYVPPIELPG